MSLGDFLGMPRRSQTHAYCVNRVTTHLKKICTVADKETKLVPGRVTDAWGYDNKKKVWYICEIKVAGTDLPKSAYQIHDTVCKFKESEYYAKRPGTIVPVLAITSQFYLALRKHSLSKWEHFTDLLKIDNTAIWVVEQSAIHAITRTKRKATTKAKSVTKRKSTSKAKSSSKRKTTTKTKVTANRNNTARSKTLTKRKTLAKAKTARKTINK
jgi:hypothetical protein